MQSMAFPDSFCADSSAHMPILGPGLSWPDAGQLCACEICV
jgi:hypothetical protein